MTSLLAASLAIDERDVLHAVVREIQRLIGTHVAGVKTIAAVPLARANPAFALSNYDDPALGASGGVRVLVIAGDGKCFVRVADYAWTAQGCITWPAVLNDPAAIEDLARKIGAEWKRHPARRTLDMPEGMCGV